MSDTTTPRTTIELILAPAARGKSAALLERIVAARGQALLLVPSDRDVGDLPRRARGARVTTFAHLADDILARSGTRPAPLGGLATAALVRAILTELRDGGELPTYGGVAHRRGFVAATAELLDDLGAADIDPAAFAAVARRPHDHELALVYRSYVRRQGERGVADLPRRLALARDALRRDPALLPPSQLVALDGFDQLTSLQLSLLAEVARAVPVAMTMTAAPGRRPAHGRFLRTLEALRASFTTREIALPDEPSRCAPAIRHLEASLFELDGEREQIPAGGALALVEAADREREVRAALRRVKRLLDGGAPPGEIALLYRDGAPYIRLLREVAAEYGVAVAIDEGAPLAEAPPVAALLELLRLPLHDYPRRNLVETLRSPYVAGGPAGIPEDDWLRFSTQLDAVARSSGVAGGLDRWRAAIARRAAAEPDPDEDERRPPITAEDAAALREPFERLVGWLDPPPVASPAGFVGWLRERARAIEVEPSPENPFADRDQAALGRLDELLGELEGVAALVEASTLPFAAFWRELEQAIAAARCPPETIDGVAALSVLAARGRTFDHVFLLGLSEGEFPRALAEPPIYRAAERRELQRRGLPLPAPDPADERTLFYQAVTRARRTLTLSRTRLDEAGTPLPRSPYLKEVLELADIPIVEIRAGSAPAWEEAASAEERALALAVLLSEGGDRRRTTDRQLTSDHPPTTDRGEVDGGRSTIVHRRPSLLSLHESLSAEYPAWRHVVPARRIEAGREGVGPYGRHEGMIDDEGLRETIAERFGPSHEWTVTQLNDYAICPYRFAAAHVLQLQPRADPEDELDGARRGSIYHAVLAEAAERWRRDGLTLSPEQAEAALACLDAAAEAALSQAPERFGFSPSPYWEWEKAEVRRRLRAALRSFMARPEWADFAPAQVEQRFGGRSGVPPLRVGTPHGVVRIRGRIDRVDRRPDGSLAVVDYKSSGTAQARSETLEGRNVQLAVYVLALQQALPPESGEAVERAAFLHIGSGRVAAVGGDDLQAAIDAARAQVAAAVAGVRAADFRVRPTRACPSYCEFEAICRKNLGKAARRETGDG